MVTETSAYLLMQRTSSCQLFLRPVSSEISDLTPCVHAQSNILHVKYAEKSRD